MKGSVFYISFFSVLFMIAVDSAYSQSQPYFMKSYPDTLHKKRMTTVIEGQAIIYGTSLAMLYQAWYKDYPQSNFHWINDNMEWMQIDKIGHAATSAYLGKFGYEFYRWSGVKRKPAIWIGGSAGFIFLSVIEILDGYSAQWGASWGDVIANAAGTGLFIGQQLVWDDQRFNLKWSYHPTNYPQYNPNELGKTSYISVLKDYNGHTYWLSGNIKSFLPKSSRFPTWLNVAVGYGADGMLSAKTNPKYYQGNPIPEFNRYRQYYLSLDVDLTRIKTQSHFLKFLFNGFNIIKIPFPTLEFNNQDGVKFHFLYF